MIYFDSSALVKRYLREEGSDAVKSLITGSKVIATSKLAYPEILSAFMRKYRNGEIPGKTHGIVLEKFESDWNKLFVVEFHDELLPIIRRLMGKYPLRGADAVHLASALWLEQATKESATFVASDGDLVSAARAESLKALDPQQG